MLHTNQPRYYPQSLKILQYLIHNKINVDENYLVYAWFRLYSPKTLVDSTHKLLPHLQIADFSPNLSEYFSSLCDKGVSCGSRPNLSVSINSINSSGSGVGGASRRSFGVPFQEETDNSKNFPSMKAFHTFKKQR